MTRIRRNTALWTSLVLLLAAAPILQASETDAGQAAFQKLKALAGTWHGRAQGGAEEGDAEPVEVTHEFRVSAAGTVVMETMNPGSADHEMINMYHLDGADLVVTHYCAGGNQPRMKLVEADGGMMRFDFTGGTNLDPEHDGHIHAGKIVILDDDTIEAVWTGYYEGKEMGSRTFTLKRQ